MRELTDRRGVSGFALFCRDTVAPDADFHCRFVFPADAHAEEPVSGTSVAAIAAFAVNNELLRRADQVEVDTEQGQAVGRPCRVEAVVRCLNDRITRVQVTGTGVVMMRGAFHFEHKASAAAI
jgi:PhzF family phenazine biosynthesis protein